MKNLNRNIIIISLSGIILILIFCLYFIIQENTNVKNKYLNILSEKSHLINCDAGYMSNQSWIGCEKDLLENAKIEKQQDFEDIIEFFKTDKRNDVLANDTNKNKDFIDWYKNSDNTNELKCTAIMYYSKVGSAYLGNIAQCEKEETLNDIKIIDELYSNLISQDAEIDLN